MICGMARRVVLLSLVNAMEAYGSWCGETHVQKCCYFLQAMLGVPLGFDFILYKHGPFSFDLRDELTAMRGDALLAIRVRDTSYGPSLTLGPNHQVLSRRFAGQVSVYDRQIDFVVQHLSLKGVAELERLGTALFITREERGLSARERAKRVNELKPHVTLEQALAAVRTVDSLLDEATREGLIVGQG